MMSDVPIRPTPHPARRRVAAAGLALVATAALGATSGAAGSAAAPARARVAASGDFADPSGLAVSDGALWVTNRGSNSVTEINPSTLRVVRRLSGSRYGFSQPSAVATYGTSILVTNYASGTVTDINARTGGVIRRFAAHPDHDRPIAAVERRGFLFVLEHAGSVAQFRISTGTLVRRIHGSRYGFDEPAALTAAGNDIWVADEAGNAVTEFSVLTGALVRRVTDASLAAPAGIGYGAGHIWVADSASDADTSIDASTGRVLQTVSSGYGFSSPSVTLVAAGHVYVASPPGSSPMVTMFSDGIGALAWYWCNTNTPDPDFSEPSAIAETGGRLFVANASGPYGDTLTVMNATSGTPIADLS